eukprot:GHVQ01018615.1.p1 GENE.GHVQ01018615.1~~GHVQ01018615.1.p1  ORF type:complete len:654 (-),score=54.37 GHVQ01018615.1:221-2182(-)
MCVYICVVHRSPLRSLFSSYDHIALDYLFNNLVLPFKEVFAIWANLLHDTTVPNRIDVAYIGDDVNVENQAKEMILGCRWWGAHAASMTSFRERFISILSKLEIYETMIYNRETYLGLVMGRCLIKCVELCAKGEDMVWNRDIEWYKIPTNDQFIKGLVMASIREAYEIKRYKQNPSIFYEPPGLLLLANKVINKFKRDFQSRLVGMLMHDEEKVENRVTNTLEKSDMHSENCRQAQAQLGKLLIRRWPLGEFAIDALARELAWLVTNQHGAKTGSWGDDPDELALKEDLLTRYMYLIGVYMRPIGEQSVSYVGELTQMQQMYLLESSLLMGPDFVVSSLAEELACLQLLPVFQWIMGLFEMKPIRGTDMRDFVTGFIRLLDWWAVLSNRDAFYQIYGESSTPKKRIAAFIRFGTDDCMRQTAMPQLLSAFVMTHPSTKLKQYSEDQKADGFGFTHVQNLLSTDTKNWYDANLSIKAHGVVTGCLRKVMEGNDTPSDFLSSMLHDLTPLIWTLVGKMHQTQAWEEVANVLVGRFPSELSKCEHCQGGQDCVDCSAYRHLFDAYLHGYLRVGLVCAVQSLLRSSAATDIRISPLTACHLMAFGGCLHFTTEKHIGWQQLMKPSITMFTDLLEFTALQLNLPENRGVELPPLPQW